MIHYKFLTFVVFQTIRGDTLWQFATDTDQVERPVFRLAQMQNTWPIEVFFSWIQCYHLGTSLESVPQLIYFEHLADSVSRNVALPLVDVFAREADMPKIQARGGGWQNICILYHIVNND